MMARRRKHLIPPCFLTVHDLGASPRHRAMRRMTLDNTEMMIYHDLVPAQRWLILSSESKMEEIIQLAYSAFWVRHASSINRETSGGKRKK